MKSYPLPAEPPRYLEHTGCRLAYHAEGSGPSVLFIQGVGVCGSGWRPQVLELRSGFHCLTFDNRGIGASQPMGTRVTVDQMADDSFALLDAMGWESAHLVGHSLGGPIALRMGLAAPARVRSLSLLCTVARGRDATRMSWRILSLGIRSRLGTLRSRRRAFLGLVMPKKELQGADLDALAEELEPLFGHDLAVQPPIAMKQLAALRGFDATRKLRELAEIPTLVVSAGEDPIAPPRFGRALASALPGARFVEFPDASHGLPIHRAAEVNALLREHLVTADASRADRP